MTENQELQAYQEQALAYQRAIEAQVVVDSEATETTARTLWSELKARISDVRKRANEIRAPLREALKKLDAQSKASVAPLEAAAAVLQARVSDYRTKLAEEARRLQEAAQQQVEAQQPQAALELSQQAAVVAEQPKVAGASLHADYEITILDPARAVVSLASMLSKGAPLRADLKKGLLAWAKAEVKAGRGIPDGVGCREITRLYHK